MKSIKRLARATVLPCCLALLTLAGVSTPAQAGQWDKKTVMTITEPLQLPNVVLEPGTYVFKLLDSSGDRHIVQVFNKEESHLVTTILAIPNYRLQVTGKTLFAFWETPAGQPRALRAWFYPGDNFGQEFAYPKNMTVQIAANNSNATVPEDTTTTTTVATNTEPAPAPEPAAVAPAPEPEPTPAPAEVAAVQPAPQPAPIETPAPQPELPQTASDYPVIALVGLLSLAAFTVLTVRARRAQ